MQLAQGGTIPPSLLTDIREYHTVAPEASSAWRRDEAQALRNVLSHQAKEIVAQDAEIARLRELLLVQCDGYHRVVEALTDVALPALATISGEAEEDHVRLIAADAWERMEKHLTGGARR